MKRLSVKSKLILMLLIASLGSILIISFLSWSISKKALTKVAFAQLTNVRISKAHQIESYFKNVRDLIQIFSTDETVIQAMVPLNKAYKKLDQELRELAWDKPLRSYYQERFLPRLRGYVQGEPNYESYRPVGQASRHLQYHYIVRNPHPEGDKHLLNDAGDDSAYSRHHARYHPFFRTLRDKLGFYDVFLIDFETGNIVYTVDKEVDYGTSLKSGPYDESGLAQAVEAVRRGSDSGAIHIVDFRPYRPSYGAPAAFVATAIYNGPHIIGILAFQLSIDAIDDVTTGYRNWKADGLGESGETYLVGDDLGMRSASRFMIEDPEGYFKALQATNTPQDIIEAMKHFRSSVLFQRVDTLAVREAIAGKSGTLQLNGYRGISILSSFTPLRIEGLNWVLLTEMDASEVYQPIRVLQRTLLMSSAVLLVLVTFAAIVASYRFVRPFHMIIDATRQVKAGAQDVSIQLDTRDEFAELAQSFNDMFQSMRSQGRLIEERNRQNEDLLLNFLPEPVARRLQKGERHIVDTIQHVSVLFANVIGFVELSEQKDAGDAGDLLNELISAFDIAAKRQGVEPDKILGVHYLALCGLLSPRLDHIHRTLNFALDMLQILDRFNLKYQTDLSMQVGIHTGAVNVGMVGDEKIKYDLWGEPVNGAISLYFIACPGLILVSPEVYEQAARNLYHFEPYATAKSEQQAWSLKGTASAGSPRQHPDVQEDKG